jgi:CrcB protein
MINPTNLLLAALGGALGSVLRVGAVALLPSAAGRLPWGTIVVNITGSLAIGLLMGWTGPVTTDNARLHSLLIVGLCGGFTTFSAFSWQTLDLFQKNQPGAALANVLISVSLCLAATWLGWRLVR